MKHLQMPRSDIKSLKGCSSSFVGSSSVGVRPVRPSLECSQHPLGSESERSLILKHNSHRSFSELIKPASPFDCVIERESPEVTPEAFLERFWEGVSIAAPNSTPEDLKEAWECAKDYQKIADGENYAALARQFWEDWNQELVNIANHQEAELSLLASLRGPLQERLEDAVAAELEEFLNALTARQQQTALSELQAATISETEAELFAEIADAADVAFDAELKRSLNIFEDFESLSSLRAATPSLQKQHQMLQEQTPSSPSCIMTNYSPPLKRAPKGGSGYTIGPEGTVEFGGGDSGDGSGGDWDGGGSGDWGSGDGGDFGGSNSFALLIFFGFGIFTGKVLYDFSYVNFKLISGKLLEAWQVKNKHKLDQLQARAKPQRTRTPKEKKGLETRLALPSLIPVLLSGSALAVLSYVLHPERLRELVALLADALAILVQELGRVLLQLLPPEFHELAHRVGAVIEFVGVYARHLVEQVVIPVLLYARTFAIWFISVFVVFKLVTLGVELYQMLAASGVANFKVPPQVTAKALEVVDRVGAITAEDSPALFLIQFSKAISLLVVGLVPVPSVSVLPKSVVKLLHLSAMFGLYSLVLCDTRYSSQLASQALQASPEFCSMVSCIAGRWCLIIITGNLVRRESALKNYSLPFACMLYFLRVYQLATEATAFASDPEYVAYPLM